MATHDFELSVTGWLRELTPKARAEIQHRIPSVPIEPVARAAAYYVLRRDYRKELAPNDARALLKRLATDAGNLHSAIQPNTLLPALESLVGQTAVVIGSSPSFIEDLRTTLLHAATAFARTADLLPNGRWRSPKERLVRGIVFIFQEAKLIVDAKPNGPLCKVVEIILADAGESDNGLKLIQRLLGPQGRLDKPT